MNQQSNKILVSVIIPTYKPGAYLQECIESICQQTIAKEMFELIIVLNGCDEPYRSNINTFLAKCQGNINVRVLQTDQPGVSNARNMGIDEAQGEFICFIDDDDWISANYLEELINVAQDGADIVASNVLCFSDETGLYTEDYITRAFKRIISPSNIDSPLSPFPSIVLRSTSVSSRFLSTIPSIPDTWHGSSARKRRNRSRTRDRNSLRDSTTCTG